MNGMKFDLKDWDIRTLVDAQTYVYNSGVVDWDWGKTELDPIKLLGEYLYRNHQDHDDFNSVLKSFITDILKLNHKDFF